jgi:hypothetical protein
MKGIPIIMIREELRSMLRNGIVELTFDKVNGERRVMECTLLPKYLPDYVNESIDREMADSEPEHLAVWDLKAEGWRSFRFDRVISYNLK